MTVITAVRDYEVEVGLIPATESTREVHSYDLEGQVHTMGNIISRTYKGEKVQRHYFDSSEGKTYRLGNTSDRFTFVDHTAAIEPLLEQGYKLKDTHTSRGGMHLYAALERADGETHNDPISWDLQFWHDARGSGYQVVKREIRESIIVVSSVRPGKGIKYMRGWFRLICTNGLVAELLNLGKVKMNHANWSPYNILPGLNLKKGASRDLNGPIVGSPKGVRRLADLMDRLSLSPTSEMDDEDEGTDDQVEQAIAGLPLFVRNEVRPLMTMPKWYRTSLTSQYRQLSEVDRDIYALDLVNAVTNPVGFERIAGTEDRSLLRPLLRSERLTDASMKLIGALSL